jgi:hypothetical protein
VHNPNTPDAPHSQTQTQHTALAHSLPPPPAILVQPLTAYTSRRDIICLSHLHPTYSVGVSTSVQSKVYNTNSPMHPTGRTREWRAELRGDPRASVAYGPRIERRFRGSTFHEASDGLDPWLQRTTLPRERRHDESSNSDVPLWRSRLERMERQDELHEQCFEAGENRPSAPQSARRWSTPDPSTPWRGYGFGLRRLGARKHDTQALREPRSSIRPELGGASWRNTEANKHWDSRQSRATRSEWMAGTTYNNGADKGDGDGLILVSEQTRSLSAQRDPGRWRNVSDDDHV